MENNIERLSDFFKVMGDSTRIKILCALEGNGMCVNQLAQTLGMTKSAISHQLKVLRLARLVKSEKKGKNVFYCLDDEHVKIILEMSMEHIIEAHRV